MPCFLKKTFLLILFSQLAYSQAYQISGRVIGLKNSQCFLGHYWGNPSTIIFKDTAKINTDGLFEFSGNTPLPQGTYIVRFPSKNQIELIIDAQQNFSFLTNENDVINTMQVQNSPENEKIYNYLKFVSHQYSLMQNAPNEQKTQYQTAIELFKNSYFNDKTSLATKIVRAGDEVVVPAFPPLPNGKPDSVAVFNYYKSHYFDNLDLSDDRLLRTNFFEQKIIRYLDNLTYQVPDSLIKAVDFLMQKTNGNAIVKKYIASKITARYENHEAVGFDAIFVNAVEKYYENDPNLWDNLVLKQVSKRAKTIKPLLVGKKIPDMIGSDILGKEHRLHEINSKYTILYIYSLNCNHCKEHAPKIANLQRKLAARGVKFYAVAMENDAVSWKNFIKTYHTENLLNLIDLKNQIDFTNQYNVLEYPTIFVLDKDKKILGKKINPAMIEKFLDFVEKK